MGPCNILVLVSDEHTREVLGCYGNESVRTPNLDRLAASGARFDNAYTPSPVCVSARASLATGRWVHETGCWSSAEPYAGSPPGWGHRLIANGHRVVSIGKLHYRATEDPNGFDEEILPMHVAGGLGWVKGLLRDPLPSYEEATREFATQIGAGDTAYTRYDENVCAAACEWIETHGAREEKPWVLFVSFVAPHFPLTAPAEHFYAYYESDALPWPKLYARGERPEHPFLRDYAGSFVYDRHFDSPDNLACVVSGRRRFTLFPPEQLPNLYVGPLDFTPPAHALRLLDLAHPAYQAYPRFREALAAALVVDLEPGDAVLRISTLRSAGGEACHLRLAGLRLSRAEGTRA